MHKFAYRVFGTVAATLIATAAFGQGTRPLDGLGACRLDEERVALTFTFEGGACQQPGEASVLPGDGGVANVTVPTSNVGDVCTMQIVPVNFAGVVDASKEIITLDVTVVNPEGQPQALGSTDIADGDEPCLEPETEAAE
jgi:hypothetical protein